MSIARGMTIAAMGLVAIATADARGDEVITKNKLVYRGTVDKDNTLRIISDLIKRVVIRDSKIERIIPKDSFGAFEPFQIVQPMEVHGGSMPSSAVGIASTPWDAKGRRNFRYLGPRLKPVAMTQAINVLGPRVYGYRGIDGFWKGQGLTSQVPREVVLGMLARVDRTILNERQRVARFLLQAEWYAEAKAEVESIAKDFPAEKERSAELVKMIQDLDARQQAMEIGVIRESRKPKELLARLRAFPTENVSPDVLADARDGLRKEEAQLAADRKLGESLRELEKGFSSSIDAEWNRRISEILKAVGSEPDAEPLRKAIGELAKGSISTPEAEWRRRIAEIVKAAEAAPGAERLRQSIRELEDWIGSSAELVWNRRIADILRTLEDAPDVARPRLDAFAKADASAPNDAKLAMAMSGWIAGGDRATANLADASSLWKARDLVRTYLRAEDDSSRSESLAALQALEFDKDKNYPEGKLDLDGLTRIVELMPPPFHGEGATPGKPMTHRVAGDLNPEPTDYMVLLPPEYHPLRSYPAVVSLHDGLGPRRAIDWWAKEAARRGYIVIAPEYMRQGMPPDYRYSQPEHAAVELALRDARKRYAIDSDRVGLHGVLLGGQMALDFGLAHPDLFAGVASVSGVPAKYVFAYRKHVKDVPLYVAIGDLAPLYRENVFDGFAKPMITDAEDVTYVEYSRRGLEDLPEEAPMILDWIDKHRRDPFPKKFEAFTARPCDARFFGVVVQEHAPGSTIAPEAADVPGIKIHPAKITYRTSNLSNLINVTVGGVNRLDVWVSPKIIDFKRRMEVRINGKAYLKGLAKPDFAPMLTDLRYRGDRQQVYWLKVSTGRGSGSGG